MENFLSKMVLNQIHCFTSTWCKKFLKPSPRKNLKALSFTCGNIIVPAVTTDKENDMCYVGRYIVRSIIEHLHSLQEMVFMKNLLDESSDQFLAQKWTESISRGSLKKNLNEAFQFLFCWKFYKRYLHVQTISNMDETF